VWTDNFKPNNDDSGVDLTDCFVEDNAIMLNRITDKIPYDFGDDKSHKAYSYVAPFYYPLLIFPLNFHVRFEDEFDRYTEIPAIKKDDDVYADRSSEGFNRYVVHHFRFKLDTKAGLIGNLSIDWYGKADNDNQIGLFYWKNFNGFGVWTELTSTKSDGKEKKLSGTISQDNVEAALDENNHFDICVIATPRTTCTLYTDYVEIFSETGEAYVLGPGYATTKNPIDPKSKNFSNTDSFYWDILTWEDYERGNATVRYHVLYEVDKKNKTYEPIKDEDLKENEKGFTDPPVHLNSLSTKKYDKIKIKANLTTDTHSVSPKIYSWAVTWQTNPTRWQDLFNYSFRVSKNKVKISDGNVNISPIRGDWTMWGQNPQNTRSSDGKGPDNDKLNWYSEILAEMSIVNPVIRDGILYTSYMDSDELYVYYDIITPENDYIKEYYDKVVVKKGKGLVNSPAITEDYIIVATGETHNEGTANFVICLYRSDLSVKWQFKYEEDICYSSSPVIANDKVFITSWSGDPDLLQSNKNNKLIGLNLSTGNLALEFDLPAGSYSTPAVYNNTVFVGCNKKTGNSLFAIDIESGEPLWNKSIGAIGRASPVVYNNTVFIVSKGICRTKVTALIANNGSFLWDYAIDNLHAVADSTPAVYNDVLYVASPNGNIYALDVNNKGKTIWKKQLYKGRTGNFLKTSPAYADGLVYIGTPTGTFYALDAPDGDIKWYFDTIKYYENHAVVTSPIVSNGLVFFGDENGKLYSIGSYEKPNQEIEGSLVSIPINLPTGFWWGKFYANYNTSEDNSITFSILDKDKNHIKNIGKGDDITMEDITIERTIRLQANLYAKNLSVNPDLFDWRVTFEEDKEKPFFDNATFAPNPEGWINEIVPVFSVQVVDRGTGLLVSSAQYVLKYSIEDEVHTDTFDADCTGKNGTTDLEKIKANISALDFFQNITDLHSIKISVKDLAGNEASISVDLNIDRDKPRSYIHNETIKESYNAEDRYVSVMATAEDDISGILQVGLFYRFSKTPTFSGNWTQFGDYVLSDNSPTWNFIAEQGGGYYQLRTIAEDKAHNVEEKENGEVSFIYDPIPPPIPEFPDVLWFNTLPTFSTIVFTDDFLLDTIEYRPNFDEVWTTIDSNISKKRYDSPWTLLTKYWNQMREGEVYYLYFRLTDSVGNINTIVDREDALIIKKDISEPKVDLDFPDLEAEWNWKDTFNISAFADDRNGSGIKTVKLYYRYSEDNTSWSNWAKYDDELTSPPFQWKFQAEKGDGYYQFYIETEDNAGNTAESKVFSTGVYIFPLVLIVGMVVLIAALILISIILFILWKKKKG
ncbi:MAG: PQQ-binding-like beta-propeller repeat protein, partial [Petrotogales bacterium]